SEAEDIALLTAVPDYVLVSDTNTEPFEALASPDYTPGSDTKTEPFEEDHQEADPEES
ncbi:hypothetical protein Tco_1280649, partial [Tanacetum coccineum]